MVYFGANMCTPSVMSIASAEFLMSGVDWIREWISNISSWQIRELSLIFVCLSMQNIHHNTTPVLHWARGRSSYLVNYVDYNFRPLRYNSLLVYPLTSSSLFRFPHSMVKVAYVCCHQTKCPLLQCFELSEGFEILHGLQSYKKKFLEINFRFFYKTSADAQQLLWWHQSIVKT